MTTPPEIRLQRWKIKTRTGATDYSEIVAQDFVAASFSDAHKALAELDMKVGAILDEAGIIYQFRVPYLTFARELWKIMRRYFRVPPALLAALVAKYEAIGARRDLLERIAEAVTGTRVGGVGGITL